MKAAQDGVVRGPVETRRATAVGGVVKAQKGFEVAGRIPVQADRVAVGILRLLVVEETVGEEVGVDAHAGVAEREFPGTGTTITETFEGRGWIDANVAVVLTGQEVAPADRPAVVVVAPRIVASEVELPTGEDVFREQSEWPVVVIHSRVDAVGIAVFEDVATAGDIEAVRAADAEGGVAVAVFIAARDAEAETAQGAVAVSAEGLEENRASHGEVAVRAGTGCAVGTVEGTVEDATRENRFATTDRVLQLDAKVARRGELGRESALVEEQVGPALQALETERPFEVTKAQGRFFSEGEVAIRVKDAHIAGQLRGEAEAEVSAERALKSRTHTAEIVGIRAGAVAIQVVAGIELNQPVNPEVKRTVRRVDPKAVGSRPDAGRFILLLFELFYRALQLGDLLAESSEFIRRCRSRHRGRGREDGSKDKASRLRKEFLNHDRCSWIRFLQWSGRCRG